MGCGTSTQTSPDRAGSMSAPAQISGPPGGGTKSNNLKSSSSSSSMNIDGGGGGSFFGSMRGAPAKFEGGIDPVTGMPEGKGRTTLKSGSKLEGDYHHGKLEGVGTHRHRTGSAYNGTFKNGKCVSLRARA